MLHLEVFMYLCKMQVNLFCKSVEITCVEITTYSEVTSPILFSLINGKMTQNRMSLQETTLVMTHIIVLELGHPVAEFRRARVTQRTETRARKGITSL
jgi:hypothetical protein